MQKRDIGRGIGLDNQRNSIRWKLLSISLLPTILLGLAIFIFGIFLIYGLSADNIHDELETTTYVLKGCFDLTVRGDYTYEDGMLKKGSINISDSTMLYDIKSKSEIDTTIFWEDTRILTTVENQYGVSAVGTKADEEVVHKVLDDGENFFAKRIQIDGRDYIGYYTPLQNDGGSIVGMIFAGKPTEIVYRNIGKIMLWFMVFSILAILFSSVSNRKFSKSMIEDIDLIKQYLHTISDGNLVGSIDKRITKRKDEIGEIGIYADKMCMALKNLVELDSLTSLYNRRSCNNQIKALIEENRKFTVVMCDIDWFKKINDQYGHDCGDYILTSISAMIRSSVGENGFASRWGGEEFLLIYELDLEAVKQKVEILAEQIRNFVFEYEDKQVKVTMTFGIKEMVGDIPYEEIIKEADDKLYTGKRNGRNQIVY